ncbi:ABC transporter G family member 15-like isoform X2 [Prosopis cineraria]|uniref:ABC transporter G family member 15-like isoform X2 n=1 Tax=Prosopis cineraria TaxID=364024 RepID=UPI00241056AE|nr:ABC transporter G family member 15-like isoform X2 [Prosopis cineraria]
MGEERSVMGWEELTVVVEVKEAHQKKKVVVNKATGCAQPGRLMALMGPSGSGKTTLLRSLSGRLARNVAVTGNVLIGGKKRCFNCKEVSYVDTEELFLGTLTVRETLAYSANLRLPSRMTREEINKVVEETIIQLGLEECADSKLGNWHLRGISSGEKKRLSIGLEILTQPHVLLLDEPTSGLDSASAFYVIQTLCSIAHDGKVVVCSIHQPSSEIFNLFDDLLLLSSGETVYFGETKMALKFFADAGFPCPTRRNPSDHFLLCVNSDFDAITVAPMKSEPASSNSTTGNKTEDIRATLIESYKNSGQIIDAKRIIQCLKSNGDELIESNVRGNTSYWKQLYTLTHRSFLNMSRDLGYYWLRIFFYSLAATGIGLFFYHLGTDKDSILARGKCVSFIYGFIICLSFGGLPVFIEELKVFYGERSKGHYGEAVFVLSNILSSFPFLLVTSLFFVTITYSMVKLHLGLAQCIFFFLNLFVCLSIIEGCLMVVASLVPNVLMGIGVATGVTLFMVMCSPLFRPLPDLPKLFWRYPMSYLSFATWAVQGQLKNDMLGLEFDPLIPGNPKAKGEQVLKLTFGVSTNHDKWWDMTALVTLFIAHRFILFLVLRYDKRQISPLRWFYAKVSPHYSEGFSLSNKQRRMAFKKQQALPLSAEY